MVIRVRSKSVSPTQSRHGACREMLAAQQIRAFEFACEHDPDRNGQFAWKGVKKLVLETGTLRQHPILQMYVILMFAVRLLRRCMVAPEYER